MKWFIPLVIVLAAACTNEPVSVTLDGVPAFSNGEDGPDDCKSGKSETSAKSGASMKSGKSEESMKSGKSEESMKSGKSEECAPPDEELPPT